MGITCQILEDIRAPKYLLGYLISLGLCFPALVRLVCGDLKTRSSVIGAIVDRNQNERKTKCLSTQNTYLFNYKIQFNDQ